MITLSQICEAIEKEEELIDGIHEISFGNEFDMNIDILLSPRAEMQNVDVEMFGDFDLVEDRSTATNDFEANSHKSKSRFGGISDFKIEKLISSQIKIQRQTLVGHLVLSKTGAKRKNRSVSLEFAVPELLLWSYYGREKHFETRIQKLCNTLCSFTCVNFSG